MIIVKHRIMRNLKVISICLVTLFLSIVITFNLSSSSSNNQAYASLENNNNEITESIKKACPNYEGNNNNDIKGLVTDILKACLPQGNQPPTAPDPNQGTFTRNILSFEGEFEPLEAGDTAKVVITDTTNDLSATYNLDTRGLPVKDTFVVPVGANYQVDATITSVEPYIYTVTINSADCQQANLNIGTCSGTMATTLQNVEVDIESAQQS